MDIHNLPIPNLINQRTKKPKKIKRSNSSLTFHSYQMEWNILILLGKNSQEIAFGEIERNAANENVSRFLVLGVPRSFFGYPQRCFCGIDLLYTLHQRQRIHHDFFDSIRFDEDWGKTQNTGTKTLERTTKERLLTLNTQTCLYMFFRRNRVPSSFSL